MPIWEDEFLLALQRHTAARLAAHNPVIGRLSSTVSNLNIAPRQVVKIEYSRAKIMELMRAPIPCTYHEFCNCRCHRMLKDGCEQCALIHERQVWRIFS